MVTNINPNEFIIIFLLGLPLVVIRNYGAESFHSYKSTDMQKYYIPLLKNHKIIILHSNNSYSEPFFPYPIPTLQNLLEFLNHLQHNQQNYQK